MRPLSARKFLNEGSYSGCFASSKASSVCVWDQEREGHALVEFNLGIEQAYGFGFGKAEAVSIRVLMLSGIDICTAFLMLQLYAMCRAKRSCFSVAAVDEEDEFVKHRSVVGLTHRRVQHGRAISRANERGFSLNSRRPFFSALFRRSRRLPAISRVMASRMGWGESSFSSRSSNTARS